MMAWVMQSMLATANAEMKQQLADEMMKQHILQLYAMNKAMVAIETSKIDIDKPDMPTEITTMHAETDINDNNDV